MPHNPNVGAVVLDANIVIALSSNEPGRDALVMAELAYYGQLGYQLFALLTFDKELEKQAAKQATIVVVKVL